MKKTNDRSDAVNLNHPIIFAPATVQAPSGVSILRISGHDLAGVRRALGLPDTLPPRQAVLCQLRTPSSHTVIDQALALYFPAPHSFTGEEVLELHTHGNPLITRQLCEVLAAVESCRMAEPGEFSKRAFWNQKMDLVQAEGLADLIHAETEAQQRQALAQLYGQASQHYQQLRESILRSLALLEAYIDFPDEDIPESVLSETEALVASLRASIADLLQGGQNNRTIREGYTISLIGPPNAGKSSLLNALAQEDVAIVSDQAGTTRDRVEVRLNLGGFLVRIIDTAGLRETEDAIEREGIKRTLAAAEEAHLRLCVVDIISQPEYYQLALETLQPSDWVVLNKSDLCAQPAIRDDLSQRQFILSTREPDSVQSLLEALKTHLSETLSGSNDAILTRERHRHALRECVEVLQSYHAALPLELQAELLRQAALAIGKITGQIYVDQLLDLVFSEFCIGK